MPGFLLHVALGIKGSVECIVRRVDRGTKSVTDNLKDVAVMCLDGLLQDGVMPREESLPPIRTKDH